MSDVDDDVVHRASARMGTLLNGKYRLGRILGIGGMATVYAATHRNGKEFAVKVLHADLSLRADARARFLREGYLANRVKHPGAVAVLDDDVTEEGEAFLVMELLHGLSVEALWEREKNALPLRLVVGIGLQMLDVLAVAHDAGLVHRDIKPGNLLLTNEGQVKVLDFGIARLRDRTASRTTQTGMVMGTPAFMAPEHAMANAKEIDAQTDVWAVGATLFTLASGLLVHEADNTQQLLVRAATLKARSFASVMNGVPEPIGEVIDRALAFDKNDRWASAAVMRDALQVAARVTFASEPSAEELADIVAELGHNEQTSVQHAPTDRPPELVGSRSDEFATGKLRAPRDAGAASREAPRAAPSKAAFAGPITAEAVATDSQLRRSVIRTRGSRGLAIGAGVIVIGGIVALGLRATPGSGAANAPSSARAASAAPPWVSTPSSAATSSSTGPQANPQAPWVPVASPPPDGAKILQPSSLPTAVVTLSPAPRPHAIGPAAPVALPAPVPAPAVATAVPAVVAPAKPACNPPYEFDEAGNKRWKRECL